MRREQGRNFQWRKRVRPGALPPVGKGRSAKAEESGGFSAFYPAAAPFYRGVADQNAGGKMELAGPQHLCADPLLRFYPRGYVEREAKALKPTALGRSSDPADEGSIQKDRGCGFYCTDGKKPRRSGGRRRRLGGYSLSTFYEDFAATLSQAEKKYGWYPGKSTGRRNG